MFLKHCFITFSLALLLSSCSNFRNLQADLEQLELLLIPISGEVISKEDDKSPVFLISFNDVEGSKILNARVLETPGYTSFSLLQEEQFLFAFQDANKDFIFQANEPYGWYLNGEKISQDSEKINFKIELSTAENNTVKPPAHFEKISQNDLLAASNLVIHKGTISSLSDPLLSSNHAIKGLWQPFDFIKDGGVGIHFLTEYDENKIPVLFVHGITGAPDNFTYLIEQLDKEKYQAWVFSYPSGLRLQQLAGGLYSILATLEHQLSFKKLHLVAHSMGGLVSRGYFNLCVQNRNCSYIRSFSTISTPWGGHDAAALGLKYAPEVVPVWQDMSPNSEYLSTLFDSTLPEQTRFSLFFSYRGSNLMHIENTDDVVSVASQLRIEAQEQAEEVFGYNENHMGILSNAHLSMQLDKIFAEN